VLWCALRHSLFNLQVDVPRWRLSCNSAVAFIVVPLPSGFVPGSGVGGRGVECIVDCGGEDPDCFSLFYCRVFFVNSVDLFVIFLSFGVLCVIFTPTV
jgi:hypothetical protein